MLIMYGVLSLQWPLINSSWAIIYATWGIIWTLHPNLPLYQGNFGKAEKTYVVGEIHPQWCLLLFAQGFGEQAYNDHHLFTDGVKMYIRNLCIEMEWTCTREPTLYVKVESTCTKVGSNSKIWSIQTVPFIFLFEVLGFLSRLRETKLTSFLLCNQAFLSMEEQRNSPQTYGRM